MDFSIEQKSQMFDILYQEYVLEHGLGGMSKTDFDTLIVFLLVTKVENVNVFELSNELKITESRIKSLLDRAAVKFDKRTAENAWTSLLNIFESVNYDIESLEKGQIRFQLADPMLYRWLQEKVRSLGDTCSYSKASEQVTINFETFDKILDILWDDEAISITWTGEKLIGIQSQIQNIVGKICKIIEFNSLDDLKNRKQPKLKKYLENAGKLVNIGQLFIGLVKLIQSSD